MWLLSVGIVFLMGLFSVWFEGGVNFIESVSLSLVYFEDVVGKIEFWVDDFVWMLFEFKGFGSMFFLSIFEFLWILFVFINE